MSVLVLRRHVSLASGSIATAQFGQRECCKHKIQVEKRLRLTDSLGLAVALGVPDSRVLDGRGGPGRSAKRPITAAGIADNKRAARSHELQSYGVLCTVQSTKSDGESIDFQLLYQPLYVHDDVISQL
ncbi:hypothetical protein VTN96DRAFT_6164 [Rasamsonia emersonii]